MKAKHLKKALVSNRKLLLSSLLIISFFYAGFIYSDKSSFLQNEVAEKKKEEKPKVLVLNKADYDFRMAKLANIKPVTTTTSTTPTTTPQEPLWPKVGPYPNGGAILPFNRIIAYYGNLYSKKMGVLGEYPEDEMLSRLDAEVLKWNNADPETKAIPALHYIAVVAQGSAGSDGKYRARMPHTEIDKVLEIAKKRDAIVFLDVQVGFSTIEDELPLFEKYLKLPQVHFAMDPEFSMKGGIRPGKVVGTYDAKDVNFAINYLSRLVRENNLPPKVLVVHRYTKKMLTNTQNITPTPEVQVVIHMDGWGGGAKKKNTYEQFVYKEPVQFTGFKIFYKNDRWGINTKVVNPEIPLLTPEELLKLRPIPVYIQYQ
ncbi:MAG: hypothetical protein KBB16_00365 [Candidatus Pacebacteria bacterium]|nr:hypothetical protein [Candidatus Paceibacterota bacterium]